MIVASSVATMSVFACEGRMEAVVHALLYLGTGGRGRLGGGPGQGGYET
jgi:hypothetical protein